MNTDELNFAYKVRHALNENLEHLPEATVGRLDAARKLALSRQKKRSPVWVWAGVPKLVGSVGGQVGNFFSDPLAWVGRMGVAVPLLVLAAGLVFIYQMEEQKHISEMAEIDAMVLSDDLPISAYLDQGFNAFLDKRGD